MSVSDPFLFASSLALGCLALALMRPIIAARRAARTAARAARQRARREHAEIEALREALRRG
ncbi:MAG: hypothetical protein RIB52_07100 [Erythrobacter sp.]|uniref:hypothetical protein n=1 Tax=Erythrobacter sp. TaxID=1042 RepID=UPI0032ECD96A